MNAFLIVLEKILYGTFNDQDKLQNDLAYKCVFNEVFENKIKNLGVSHYLFQKLFYDNYCKDKLRFSLPSKKKTSKKRQNKKSHKRASKPSNVDSVNTTIPLFFETSFNSPNVSNEQQNKNIINKKLNKKKIDSSFIEDKYTFIDETLHNSFLSDQDKKKFMSIMCKCQNTVFQLNKFLFIYKMKKAKYGCETDMYLNPISEKNKNVVAILHENTKYLFTVCDVKKIGQKSLANSDEMYSDPLPIKNPYNNLPFSKSNLYTLYFFIKKSDYVMPVLFHNYFLSNFCISSLHDNNQTYLRSIAINQILTCEYSQESQIDYIHAMIEDYNLRHKQDSIIIDTEFPSNLLLKVFLPFLKYYLKGEYSLCNSERMDNRLIINAMLFNFKKNNPIFGRKYFINEYDTHIQRPAFKRYFHTTYSSIENPFMINKNYTNSHKVKNNYYSKYVLDYMQNYKNNYCNTHIRWNFDTEDEEIDSDDESQESESVS